MGGAFAYTYLYVVCCGGIGVLFLMGWGLVWYGRRQERRNRALGSDRKSGPADG